VRKRPLVFSEEFLSSLDIFDVADDAGLGVSSKALDESVLPVDLLKDDQTLPSFAVVIGHLLVVAKEEQFEFFGTQLENRRYGELRRFVVLRHEGLF